MTDQTWQNARNILCIRLDQIGDVLMCTPAIRALKEALPGRRITLMSSGSGGAVAPYIPEIDAFIEYASPWMKINRPHDPAEDLQMIAQLQAFRFDAAVIFTTYSQSPLPAALLCYLARIPLRLAHCRENPYHLLTHWVQESEPQQQIRHEVQRQLDLVAAVGAIPENDRMSMRVPEAALERVRDKLMSAGVDLQRPLIVLHPGSTASSRRYPPAQWADAARILNRRLGHSLVFTGDKSEIELVDSISRGIADSYSLAGKLDLGELAALISLARLMISNNTGPAHMAAALGTPLVDLYALTNPQHTPWRVPHRVLYHDVPCRFCYKSICPQGHHHCLVKVTPEQVANAAESLLDEVGDPAPYRQHGKHVVRAAAVPLHGQSLCGTP